MDILKERLLKFIDYLGVEKSIFESNAGLSNGFVDKVGNNVRSKSLALISKAYPRLNIDWLKTGEGEMLNHINQSINDVKDSSVVGSNISGNGNNITNNEVTVITKLVDSYQEIIREKDNQISKLIYLLEKKTHNEYGQSNG